MKSFHLFICLLLNTYVIAQQNAFSLSLSAGLELDNPHYTYNDGTSFDEFEVQKATGHIVGLHLSLPLNSHLSLRTGLNYQEKNAYPRLDLGWWYGGVFQVGDSTHFLNIPYLQKHSFKNLEWPIALVMTIGKSTWIKPYLGAGLTQRLTIRETEQYASRFGGPLFTIQEVPKPLAIEDKEVRYFGLSLDLMAGLDVALGSRWSLLLEYQTQAWDFRKKNEKFVRNDEILYENSYRWFNSMRLTTGVKYAF